MCRCRLKALLPSPQESVSAGKCGPQRAPQETPQAGMLAAQESMPTILRDPAPGHFEEGPPWDIEEEPGGEKTFDLKRPFEAKKVDSAGHTGHHKNESGRSKIASVQAAPQISKHHIPLDLSSRAAVKFVQHSGLEAEREGVAVQVVLWQHKTLRSQPPCDESRHRHAHSRVRRRVARWPHSEPWTSDKAKRTPIH